MNKYKYLIVTLILPLLLMACNAGVPSTPAGSTAEAEQSSSTSLPPASSSESTTSTNAVPPDSTVNEELLALQQELTQLFYIGADVPRNYYNFALLCQFSTPAELDFLALFGNGDLNETVTAEERAYLEAQDNAFADMDISKVSAQRMNEVLQNYFGVTLEETNQLNLDCFTYYAETDSYFHATTGFNYVPNVEFTVVELLEDGCVYAEYCLFGTTYAIVLRPTQDGYHLLSNQAIAEG